MKYANEAAGWAGKAQQSAATAQEHARKAGESLQFALQQQQRAHAAADQAENDARAAANNADQAASYAAQAHASADQAAASAAQARSSADAAGHDADLASQAAQEAYNIAWEKQLHEQEQYRAAAAEGELESYKTSLLDAIKQQVGQDALDLLLDLIGVKDVLDCFKGDVSACLWAAAGALPLGKAIPVIKKLIGKIGDIKATMKNSRFSNALDKALKPGSCVRPSAWSGAVTLAPAVWKVNANTAGGIWRNVVDECRLRLVNGRKPIGYKDAGSTWRHEQKAKIPDHIQRNYGDIHVDVEGFPEFTPHVVDLADYGVANGRKADMVIPLSPKLNDDFALADERAGIDEAFRKEHGLVWHHHQDVSGGRGRVQLIPSELHDAVKHTGGGAIYREYLKSILKG